MAEPTRDRRAELIIAAIAGELTPDETVELDALRATDPTIDTDLAQLGGVADRATDIGTWTEVAPSASLRDRIAALADDESAEAEPPAVIDLASRRRPRAWQLIAGAAACVAIGVVAGTLIPIAEPSGPTGPPGTLGAVEHVEFVGEPSGVGVEGDLVAHTWGTETDLVISGAAVGESYTVTLVGRDGAEYDSGTFLGSAVEIDCRMNAAVLREDVASVVIRDQGGDEIAVAEVPSVGA
ncbi:anti-sigma factor [Amnibacterium flavum]|uniref:Anti-sigma factor n=1 Tax=Amnibacterium flavum TaxID=2173173 RepID=A0A2V1HRA3_9MICO|nr:anti-sigma factor [Amnibacterium flavum]PVZ93500.1 hypothetical protein DDQ50_14345 [Amnibacterium flavum]